MGKRGPAPGHGGRPPKPLADKVLEGNPGKRKLTLVEFSNSTELQGEEMPQPSTMLSAVQRDGSISQASEIYKITWKWLDERGVQH